MFVTACAASQQVRSLRRGERAAVRTDTVLPASEEPRSIQGRSSDRAAVKPETTLEPKMDALRIDIGHLREEHKKLKERVNAPKNTVSDLHPSVADAASDISDLQKEVTRLRQRIEDQEGRS
ncbi:hypothetical protein NDU88_003584 [Pleurodeles waltl]|uniref:Uncharacterized protein n=1 Tax=Pleurodeles waltl TaxID=8319 RepID=A0AAV7MS18_PLEWA|nr:hypothetical protein NDU88_003584 [Pleurodeles waltl]